jgi:hypothetical protein
MVATAIPGPKECITPPLYQVVGVIHTTTGGKTALRGDLKCCPPTVVDSTYDKALHDNEGRDTGWALI